MNTPLKEIPHYLDWCKGIPWKKIFASRNSESPSLESTPETESDSDSDIDDVSGAFEGVGLTATARPSDLPAFGSMRPRDSKSKSPSGEPERKRQKQQREDEDEDDDDDYDD